MKRPFLSGSLRQVLAAAAVIVATATTAIAQENQQTNDGQQSAANVEGANAEGAQQEASQQNEKKEDKKQEQAAVLKIVELKTMSVGDFMSAAQLAGVMDRRATYTATAQNFNTQQSSDQQRLYVATKPEASLIFLRGPEKKVSKVEAFAKKVDVNSEEMPETLQFENGKQARRIPQAELDGTRTLLQSLGFTTTQSTFGNTHFLVFEETEESKMKQIEQVLDKLSEGREKEGKTEKGADQKEDGADQEGANEEPQAEGDAEKNQRDSQNDDGQRRSSENDDAQADDAQAGAETNR